MRHPGWGWICPCACYTHHYVCLVCGRSWEIAVLPDMQDLQALVDCHLHGVPVTNARGQSGLPIPRCWGAASAEVQ